jgi:hypothetical protein
MYIRISGKDIFESVKDKVMNPRRKKSRRRRNLAINK